VKIPIIGYTLSLGAAAAMLTANGLALPQTSVVGNGPPDRSIHVIVDGIEISEKDVTSLIQGLYDAGTKRVDTIKKKPAEMPAQSPYVYFAGRNTATGREIVWQSAATYPDAEAKRANDEYTAAYALAALDAGYVGEPWKALYEDAVKDDKSRLAFGEQISRAIDEASDQRKSAATADVAWLRQHITIGMSRSKVYAALRSYGLVPYNYDYAAGTPITSGHLTGCDNSGESNELAAAWPHPGEPLPKRVGGCATIPHAAQPEPFPTAYMTLQSAFSIACGSEIHVTMAFGPGDTLTKMNISKPEWGCV